MESTGRYRNRSQAGRVLAVHLAPYTGFENLLVCGLARGGVPVACEVAEFLNAPLEVLVVQRLALSANPSRAVGALAPGEVVILDQPELTRAAVPPPDVENMIAGERNDFERRANRYRRPRENDDLRQHTVVLIDDGLVTGFNLQAAIASVHQRHCRKIVVAVPVGSPAACDQLSGEVDALICPLRPPDFHSASEGYEDYPEITDRDVHDCLRRAGPDRVRAGPKGSLPSPLLSTTPSDQAPL